MIFANAQSIIIPEGSVSVITAGGKTIWKKSALPPGYTELDYIETTGTQYINTEFIPNQDSRVVCEFKYIGGNHIYGARYNAASATNASRNFAFRAIGTGSPWQPCYGYTLGSTGVKSDNEWHTADQNKNIFRLDGVELGEGVTPNAGTTVENGVLTRVFDEQEFTAPLPLLIGAINSASGGGNIYCGKNRFRFYRIYDNGVPARDYLPCINPDEEIGMYDVLNAKFYGNSGTGKFVAGKAI